MLFSLLVLALIATAGVWLFYGWTFGLPMLLAFVLVLFAIYYYIWISNQLIADQFVFLAKRYKIKYEEPERKHYTIMRIIRIMLGLEPPGAFLSRLHPMVSGVYLDRFIKVAAKGKVKGGAITELIVVEVDVLPFGNTFSIKPETCKMRLLKWFRWKKDVLTGDKDFDNKFFVEGKEKFMKKLLDPPIIQLFRDELFKKMGNIHLEQGILRYEEKGLLNDDEKRERIEKVIELMYLIARKLDFMRLGK